MPKRWPNAYFAKLGLFTIHHNTSLNSSELTPMRKLLTGEPNAGEPHVRFGGRGRRESFPTPIDYSVEMIKIRSSFDRLRANGFFMAHQNGEESVRLDNQRLG